MPKHGVNLTITGIWGLSDVLPNDLKFGILNLALDLISVYKRANQKAQSNGRDLSSLRVNEVTYNYRDESKTSLSNLTQIFENSSTLQNLINDYV